MAHEDVLSILGRDLVAVGRLWRRLISARLAAHGLPDAQWLILDNLHRSGDNISQKTIAQRLGLEQSALVRVLKELEAQGHITRTRAPEDSRTRIVTLTEQGRSTVDAISAGARRFDETILAGFTSTELQRLYSQLQVMRKRLTKLDSE